MNPVRFPVPLKDVVWGMELWRFLPAINVDRVKDIPIDYPGPMGVPITFIDKLGRNDGHTGFLLVDQVKPSINGRWKYARLIIRNLKPDLPEIVDLADWIEK